MQTLGSVSGAWLVVLVRCNWVSGSEPTYSRTAAIFLIRVVRRALNLLRASFSPIFQYFSAINVTPVSFFPIFQYLPCQERLRIGYDSTPDPAYSCLLCSAQRKTATWLLYRVLYSLLAGCSVCHFAHARPTMLSISLIIIYFFLICRVSLHGVL